MAPTHHEAGLVAGDEFVHASKKHISGSTALCGAGRVTVPVAGRFDPDVPNACPACSAAVAPLPDSTSD